MNVECRNQNDEGQMTERMPHTLEIPEGLEKVLKDRAAPENKTIDAVVIEALARGVGIELHQPAKVRDLSDIAGRRLIGPETEAGFAEQRRIDRELWQ